MNKNERSPQIRNISIDALVDDILGVSVLSLKTIGVSFSDPKSYYDAGRTLDWDGRFTPSFRLWFMLVAIAFFFQFVWAGAGSPMIEMYGQNMRDNNIVLPTGVAYDTAATTFARVYFSFIPIIVSSMLFLLAVVYRAWGQVIPFVVRARTVFSIVVPSSLIQIFAL